jgi:antitoxin component YwqK of YwqJK toxin-antitoxin module
MAFTGKGICYFDNHKYEGEFVNGKLNGNGIIYYENNKIGYEGEFVDGQLIEGIEYFSNGSKNKEGEFANWKLHGKGIQYFINGKKNKEGEFVNGKLHGKGILYFYTPQSNHDKIYKEGEFKDGQLIKGIEYFSNGFKDKEGEFSNCKLHGKGKQYNQYNGIKKYEGEFVDGQFIKGIEYDDNGNIILTSDLLPEKLFDGNQLLDDYDLVNDNKKEENQNTIIKQEHVTENIQKLYLKNIQTIQVGDIIHYIQYPSRNVFISCTLIVKSIQISGTDCFQMSKLDFIIDCTSLQTHENCKFHDNYNKQEHVFLVEAKKETF